MVQAYISDKRIAIIGSILLSIIVLHKEDDITPEQVLFTLIISLVPLKATGSLLKSIFKYSVGLCLYTKYFNVFKLSFVKYNLYWLPAFIFLISKTLAELFIALLILSYSSSVSVNNRARL